MNQSDKTVKGISKGKRKALELVEMFRNELCIEAVTEYRFAALLTGGTGKGLRERMKSHGLKDWRFDIAIPEHMIAIELDGGTWTNGRHSRGVGVISDMDKLNTATVHGWRVLRFTHTDHKHSHIIKLVRSLLLQQSIIK